MNNRIVIYKSKNKAFILVLVSLLLAIAGWLLIQYAERPALGWSAMVLAFLCLVFGIGTWFDRKPYLILTANGLTELTNVREEIDWDAIRRVDDFYYRGQHFIRLLVDRNYKPDQIRPTWFYRFDRFYEKEGVKAIFIRVSFFEVNSMKLAQFINRMIHADASKRVELLNRQPADW